MQPQEIFSVSGNAPDVQYARAAAWEALRQVLGSESEEHWRFHRAFYTIGQLTSGETTCSYQIEIVRVPDEE